MQIWQEFIDRCKVNMANPEEPHQVEAGIALLRQFLDRFEGIHPKKKKNQTGNSGYMSYQHRVTINVHVKADPSASS